jgi:hypothetical protein
MASPTENAEEPKKKKKKPAKQPAEGPKPLLYSIGLNLGRTTRFLSKQSRSIWRGSGGALTVAARKMGARLGGSESKQKKRSGRGWRSRPKKIRREMEDIFLAIGQEVYKSASEEGSSLEVSDEVRELITRASELQEELDGIKAAEEAADEEAVEGAIEDVLPDVETGAELGDEEEQESEEGEEGEYESVLGGEPDLPVRAEETETKEKEK